MSRGTLSRAGLFRFGPDGLQVYRIPSAPMQII